MVKPENVKPEAALKSKFYAEYDSETEFIKILNQKVPDLQVQEEAKSVTQD